MALSSSEMLVHIYQTSRRYISQNSGRRSIHFDNLKLHKIALYFKILIRFDLDPFLYSYELHIILSETDFIR
jgi:hypothetical protein